MLTTAEAADVMKKPIHEEIIILQNYFKSMRAKMDGAQGVLGTGCHHSGCPATVQPPLRVGLPGFGGQGTIKPPAPGAGQTGGEKYYKKQNVAQKNMALEPAEDCRLGFWCSSSQDGQQLAPNSPVPGDGG